MKPEYHLESDGETAFREYFLRTKEQVDSELAKFVSNLSQLSLYPQIKYAVLSNGKRLRPLLVILAAESTGGTRSKVMPLAMAFELMHTATLVHDDVIDQDGMRRGRLAMDKKWSVNDAILTGDALIALAVSLASGFGETVLKNVAQSALELCDGEYSDIVETLETTTEDSYFRKIRGKSASFCRAAAYCGALVGGSTLAEAFSLSTFGENFGMAYQLRDDVLDFTLKGDLNVKDLKSGRITMPLIHLYTTSTVQEKREIETKLQTIMNENSLKSNENANDILQAIHHKGAFDYCEKKIDEYLSQAVPSISTLKDTEYRTHLIEMAKTLKSGECPY